MKVLFMGTPDIAAVSFKRLIDDGFEIVGVVTQPDKPKGRGHNMCYPPVKEEAIKLGIEVYQPEKLKNGELIPVLEKTNPDVIAVVAYGKILPKYVLDFPKYGCINMHASLLPKYRGAAPIQWSVINGDEKTGVTTMLMDEGLDTGDMLITKELSIGLYETSEELFERVAVLGAEVLSETLSGLDRITPVKQDAEKSTYAPMISKDMGNIDWNLHNTKISKHICGMNSWPLAYTFYDGIQMKVISAVLGDEGNYGEPGTVLGFEKDMGLKVQCGNGTIYLTKIQFPGGKKMEVSEYLKGHTIEKGKKFTFDAE